MATIARVIQKKGKKKVILDNGLSFMISDGLTKAEAIAYIKQLMAEDVHDWTGTEIK
jgi:hypothetical protein